MNKFAIRQICSGLLATILLLTTTGMSAMADDHGLAPEIKRQLTNPAQTGDGIYTWFGFEVYQARLWTESGSIDRQDPVGKPLALSLTYSRNIEGADIADASADEIKGLGLASANELQNWLVAMRSIFPDVTQGDTLTGILTNQRETRFYLNDQFIGSIPKPEFSRAFFSIWLSEKTSSPVLRKQLLRNAVPL